MQRRPVKPVILCVDDEPNVLNAVQRDLRSKYASEFRIHKAGSGAEGLELLRGLKKRETPVALLLSDHRMPVMTGTQFLSEAKEIFPEAKRVLLTAYADTDAAIASINEIGLDYYLQKPWDPPEEKLYPVLDDLIFDWKSNTPPSWDGLRVAGTMWSSDSHDLKDFLARNRVPYQWQDVELDEIVRQRCESICREAAGDEDGNVNYPVLFLGGGKQLINPSREEVAAAIGMKTQAERPLYDLIVIGGGPSGLGAAVYGASEGLSTALIEREATGGQAGTSSLIENYLGFPAGVSGADLASRAVAQAKRFGAELLTPQEVTRIEVEQPYKHVHLADGSKLSCYALLLCPGMEVRKLQAPGIEEHSGRGIYYGAALTEAAHYRDQPAVVIGGANSAGQGAKFFSRYASEVTMLIRRDIQASMSQYLIDQIAAIPNIRVWNYSTLEKADGQDKLEKVVVKRKEGDSEAEVELDAAAMYIFIGSSPRTALVEDIVARDEKGFILTGDDVLSAEANTPGHRPAYLETSVPGIFAAGDARYGSQKRVAAAVGEGAVAVALIHRYLAGVR